LVEEMLRAAVSFEIRVVANELDRASKQTLADARGERPTTAAKTHRVNQVSCCRRS
jgi:hypothetical protein